MDKKRTSVFNWRGQFTPQFVDYLLEYFAKPGDIIVDPFSGSGTVLLESSRKEMTCYGLEINPSAYTMSKFFSLANVNPDERMARFDVLEEKIIKATHCLGNVADKSGNYSRNVLGLSKALLAETSDFVDKIIILNILFIYEKNRNRDLFKASESSVQYIKNVLNELPYTNQKIDTFLADARLSHIKCPEKANLILTSPPYINVFNYHQNFRLIMETVGWDILKVARSEFGSNRKYRSNRFKTVVQYCLDMEQALASFWELLDRDGILVMIIGKESHVLKVPFQNGKIVRDIIKETGSFEEIGTYQRTFMNRFGNNIKEDILVLGKSSQTPNQNVAIHVATHHLNHSLFSSDNPEIRKQIIESINNISTIQPSPIFDHQASVF